MTELLVFLFFMFSMSAGLTAFFYSYEQTQKNLQHNFDSAFKRYERSDLWRSSTSLGSRNLR